jgi:hypothetical protein
MYASRLSADAEHRELRVHRLDRRNPYLLASLRLGSVVSVAARRNMTAKWTASSAIGVLEERRPFDAGVRAPAAFRITALQRGLTISTDRCASTGQSEACVTRTGTVDVDGFGCSRGVSGAVEDSPSRLQFVRSRARCYVAASHAREKLNDCSVESLYGLPTYSTFLTKHGARTG